MLEQTAAELERQVATLSRGFDTTKPGGFSVACDQDEAVEITNLICPEHLHIAIDNPYELQERPTTAGATFMGNHTPVALGDYVAGPHIRYLLRNSPLGFGLSSNDFLR